MMMQPRVYDEQFLFAAVVILSMTLIFYSVGVWSERIQGRLKGWHVVALGLGVVCNFAGTTFMGELARLLGHANCLHTVLCSISIFLMTLHAVWAFWTFRKGAVKAKYFFSRFGIVVWSMWLILYIVGIYMGIGSGV